MAWVLIGINFDASKDPRLWVGDCNGVVVLPCLLEDVFVRSSPVKNLRRCFLIECLAPGRAIAVLDVGVRVNDLNKRVCSAIGCWVIDLQDFVGKVNEGIGIENLCIWADNGV